MEAERGGDNEDGENDDVEEVSGGGVIFLVRFAVVEDGLFEDGFSLTGDNPCINVDHGAICLAISEAAALLAADALLTVFASPLSTLALEWELPLEFEPEYPRLWAYGLNELIEEDPAGRSVFFNGLSATRRCWVPLVILVLATPVDVGMALSPAAMVDFGLDTTEDMAGDTAGEPTTEGEAFNGVALGVFPGVA